jgi:hypothetical protein
MKTPTPYSIAWSTTPTESNSPAHAPDPRQPKSEILAKRHRRCQKIHWPARLATRAASFRYGGRHHPGIPGVIIPLYLGGFVGIRRC